MNRRIHIFFIPAVVCIGALGITYLLWMFTKASLASQATAQFQSRSTEIKSLISKKMEVYTGLLSGAQGLFAASDTVEADEWSSYVAKLDLAHQYKGAAGMSFIKRVPKAEVASFPYTIYPSTKKEVYYPFAYVSSITDTAKKTLGFDASSESKRFDALMTAAKTDTPTASAVVLSVSAQLPSFSIYAPIYTNGARHTTQSERMNALKGFVIIGFRVEELFADIAADPTFDKNIDLEIYDATSEGQATAETLIYDTDKQAHALERTASRVTTVQTIKVAGRTWTLYFSADEGYQFNNIESYAPLVVLFGGILVSIILTWLMYIYAASRNRAIALANKITKDLAAQTVELKRETKALAEIKAKDEAILSSIGDGVAVADTTGKLIYWNTAAEEIVGIKFGETQSDDWEKTYGVFYPDEKTPMPGEEQALALAVKGQTIDAMPEFIRNAGVPEGRHIAVSAKPVKLADGTVLGAVAIFRDVTKEFEVDKAKTEFVSLASHQLRTPLTAINWYSEMLGTTGKLTKDQQSFAAEINTASTRMSDLVNSLLNVSRLELGTFAIEPEPADIVAIAEAAIHEQEITFKTKKQTFTFTHDDALPTLALDKRLIHITIQNLLSNASKYTPDGGEVTLAITKKGKGIRITCIDNGYGIPKAQQKDMFKKLFRADNVKKLAIEGTGLGLYIIKSIIEAAGSTISFKSTEGKGTTFTIDIPAGGMKSKIGDRTLSQSVGDSAILKK